MKDEYGFESGDGFGTDAPTQVWTNYGDYPSPRDVKTEIGCNGDNHLFQYRVHPHRSNVLQWKLHKV